MSDLHTLGTRNRPRSTAGALFWLASRSFGSLTTSGRRRSDTWSITAVGWASGSTPVVSTAFICSTMSKKALSWERLVSLWALESSRRARLAMRPMSDRVRDMTETVPGWKEETAPEATIDPETACKRQKCAPIACSCAQGIRYYPRFNGMSPCRCDFRLGINHLAPMPGQPPGPIPGDGCAMPRPCPTGPMHHV